MERPQRLAGSGVECREIPVSLSDENAPLRVGRAGLVAVELALPLNLAVRDSQGVHLAALVEDEHALVRDRRGELDQLVRPEGPQELERWIRPMRRVVRALPNPAEV